MSYKTTQQQEPMSDRVTRLETQRTLNGQHNKDDHKQIWKEIQLLKADVQKGFKFQQRVSGAIVLLVVVVPIVLKVAEVL